MIRSTPPSPLPQAVLPIFLVVSVGLLVLAWTAGGEFEYILQAGAQYLPFFPLVVLGMAGQRHAWARVVSYLYAALLQLLIAAFTFSFATMGFSTTPGDLSGLPADALIRLLLLGIGLVGGIVVSAGVFLPPVGRTISRWIPVDPEDFRHLLALWIVAYVIMSTFLMMVALGGQPPLLTAITSGALPSEEINARSSLGQKLDLIYGLIWLIPLVLMGAGWPLNRPLGATLQRLGLTIPPWRHLLMGCCGAVFLVMTMLIAGEGVSAIWQWFGWVETDSEVFEELLGATISPIGALVIGFTAGLGEELAVRGLLQPRLGIFLSNLAFTAVHSYQYGLDALLIVFLLGNVLGIVRLHSNTTTAALVHGVYNALLVLASALAIGE